MSDVVARPMPVPDLAGLLARPKRSPQTSAEKVLVETVVGDPPSLVLGHELPDAKPDPQGSASEPSSSAASRRTVLTSVKAPPSTNRVDEAAPTGEPGRQYLRTKAVQLPRSIHRRVTDEAVRRGTTATALMLMAINSTHQRLPEALRRQTHQASGALFDIPQDRAGQEPTVQTTLRMTDVQLDVINELVTANSTNRSRLFGTAIALFLDLPYPQR
jgi:hypothetical protein